MIFYLSERNAKSFLFESEEQDLYCIRIFDNKSSAINYRSKMIEEDVFMPSQVEVSSIDSLQLFNKTEDLLSIMRKSVGKNANLKLYLTEVDSDFNITKEEEVYNSTQYLN